MKIDVTEGAVLIRSVVVRNHLSGLYTVTIETPCDARPVIALGLLIERAKGRSVRRYGINLFPRDAANSLASRVILTMDTMPEREAFEMGMVDLDWTKHTAVLLAVPRYVVEYAEIVTQYERWEPQHADYLKAYLPGWLVK